jgi:hypothetical protein
MGKKRSVKRSFKKPKKSPKRYVKKSPKKTVKKSPKRSPPKSPFKPFSPIAESLDLPSLNPLSPLQPFSPAEKFSFSPFGGKKPALEKPKPVNLFPPLFPPNLDEVLVPFPIEQKEEDIAEKNKSLLEKTEYTSIKSDFQGNVTSDPSKVVRAMYEAREPTTQAHVMMTMKSTISYIEPINGDFSSVGEAKKVPGSLQSYKIYIDSISANESKGIVRKMMCRLLRKALHELPWLHETDGVMLWACGEGPGPKYSDLLKMYERMGFRPALIHNEDLSKAKNCEVYMTQTIQGLLTWCGNYDT